MIDDSYSTITLESEKAKSVAFSPDEKLIYAARSDGFIDVFETSSRTKVATWEVGQSLGALSVSEDGSFLLVLEDTPPSQESVVYKVSTSNGASTTFSLTGYAAYRDVEIVDADTAILTGGQADVTLLDLSSGTYSPLPNAIYYANYSAMSEDKHLTLLAEQGISNGPLALFDDRTNSIIARGDNYQTMKSEVGYFGNNTGSEAVSEAAGLVAQYVSTTTINLFDLNLKIVGEIKVPWWVNGIAFDPTGTYLFVRLESGPLQQYEVATGALIESLPLPHSDTGTLSANQITFSADGKTILIQDSMLGRVQLIDLHARDQKFVGTGGPDFMAGGRGDDTYIVNLG